MNSRIELFRLPPWPWAVLYGAIWLPAIWEGAQLSLLLAGVCAAIALVFAMLMLRLSELRIREEGLVLYHVNKMAWGDAVAARLRGIAGLRYLHVRRARGMSWWIPLYLVGSRGIMVALADRAPEGNPIRTCLNDGGANSAVPADAAKGPPRG